MFIYRVISIIGILGLSACATAPEQPADSGVPAIVPEVKSAPVKDETKPSIKQDVKTAIDPDVLFMLLTAELAGQRGQYEIALEGYLEAAKRVKDPRFAERAAMIAMYMKDSKKINEAVALWLHREPDNLTARKLAALSAFRAGDKAAAFAHTEALLLADPAGFEKTMLELIGVLQKDAKTKLLYQIMAELAQKHSKQATVFFVQALLAMQMNNKDLAERSIDQALMLQPGWDKALMLKSQLAMVSGDMTQAKKVLQEAILKYPKDTKLKKMLAQVLIKAKAYGEAMQVYQQLVDADSKDKESLFALALVYMQLNQEAQAEQILERLLLDSEWQSQAGFYLGKLAEKQGDTAKALALYDKSENGFYAFDSAVSAVTLLARQKQFDEAQQRLTEMVKKFPKHGGRITLLQAEVFNQQKHYQKAFELLTQALLAQPDDKDLLYMRALMAERIGKPSMMEADLKKILEKNPDSAEALNALGYSLADKTTRYADAEKYLRRALALQPDEAVILDSYGWLQYKLGRHEQALDYLQRAYAKQQENEIAAHIAEVLWVLGKKEQALKIFDAAINKAPDDEYLLDFKRRILDNAK